MKNSIFNLNGLYKNSDTNIMKIVKLFVCHFIRRDINLINTTYCYEFYEVASD